MLTPSMTSVNTPESHSYNKNSWTRASPIRFRWKTVKTLSRRMFSAERMMDRCDAFASPRR